MTDQTNTTWHHDRSMNIAISLNGFFGFICGRYTEVPAWAVIGYILVVCLFWMFLDRRKLKWAR